LGEQLGAETHSQHWAFGAHQRRDQLELPREVWMLGGVVDAHWAAHHDEPVEPFPRRQRLAEVGVAKPQL
jgi:hypothetical protein